MNKKGSLYQAYRQTPWRSQFQTLGLFTLFLIVIGVVAAFYLNVTAKTTTSGRRIQFMQATISVLELENAAIQSDLAQMSSLDAMTERAQELGFESGNTEETEFIQVEGLALSTSPKIATGERPVLVGVEQIPEEYTESIITWIKRKFSEYAYVIFEVIP
jgi:cell division protein FtsL